MSDAFQVWHVKSRASGTLDSFVEIGTAPAGLRFFDDTRTVPAGGWDYHLEQTTANGVAVPYNNVGLTASSGTVAWVVELVGGSTTTEVRSVKVASDGSVIFCGDFSGSLTVLGTTLTSGGGYDGFLGKFNSNGTLAWLKQYSAINQVGPNAGNGGDEAALSAVADSSGNVYVTGSFTGRMDLGSGNVITSPSDAFDRTWSDIFVAKYNSSGAIQWGKRFGGTAPDTGDGIAVDGSGNVYFVSRLNSTGADFGSVTLSTTGNLDIAICKLNSAGAVQWAVSYGGTDGDWAHGIALDSSGNVFLCGETWYHTNIGGGVVVHSNTANAFVAKYRTSDGAYMWGKIFDNGSLNRANGIVIDTNTDNVIIVGGMGGSLDFSLGTVPGAAIGGGLFIAAFSNSGTYLWARGYGGSSPIDGLLAVGIDRTSSTTSNLSVAGGAYAGAVDLGGGWLIGNGNQNMIVGSFTIAGNSPPVHRWSWRSGSGSSSVSQANGVALGTSALVVGGHMQNTTIFSPSGPSITTAGNKLSAFVVKYAN